MRIVVLTPTYRRPRLLANCLACFLAQSHADRHMLIGDDSGELPRHDGGTWSILAMRPQATLPAKYNVMADYAFRVFEADAIAVMEDDDVYYPGYLAAHAAALASSPDGWSHPSWVWTDGSGGPHGGELRRENTGHARLHGCLAISRACYDRIGGWPETPRMDFDLQLLARLRADSPPADPCDHSAAQYFFRWASTAAPHGQAHSTGPGDENWLAKCQQAIDATRGHVRPCPPPVPAFDAETRILLSDHQETHDAQFCAPSGQHSSQHQ